MNVVVVVVVVFGFEKKMEKQWIVFEQMERRVMAANANALFCFLKEEEEEEDGKAPRPRTES